MKFFLAFLFFSAPLFLLNVSSPFIYDDKAILEDNEWVKNQNFRSLWTHTYWQGVVPKNVENLHRPLFLSLASVFRSEPTALRAFLFVSHSLIAMLIVFFLMRHFGFEEKKHLFLLLSAGCVFLFHPGQVEVTAQIVGLMECLPMLLGLGALYLEKKFPTSALLICLSAPGWKETGYLSLFIIGFCFLRRKRWLHLSGVILATVFWLSLRFVISGSFFSSGAPLYSLINPIVDFSFWDHFWSVFTLLGMNLRLFFFPYPLSSDYSRGAIPLPGYPIQVYVILSFLFLLFLVRYRWTSEKSPILALGLFSVLPTLNILPSVMGFAERFGYGLRVALTIFTFSEIRKLQWKFKSGALVALLCAFYLISFERHRDWQSSERLFRSDLYHFPKNAKLHYNLGMSLGAEARWSEAETAFVTALFLEPDFADAHYNLGRVYSAQNRIKEAEVEFERAKGLGRE